MHELAAAAYAASTSSGRDALAWIDDILTAVASFAVVVGAFAGARYLRRANVRLATCALSPGGDGWLILRASAQIENRGFLRLSFKKFRGEARPSITVAETVDVPAPDGAGRQIREVRSWVVFDLDSDLVDPGEIAAWTEVFHLDPPTRATVGYRVTCKIPVTPSLWARLTWRLGSWRRLTAATPDLTQWWEHQTFVPLSTPSTPSTLSTPSAPATRGVT